MKRAGLLLVAALWACGPTTTTIGGTGGAKGGGSGGNGGQGGAAAGGGAAGAGGAAGSASGGGSSTGGGSACPASVLPRAGPEATLAAPYSGAYTAYELGAVPGVPMPLGGCVIRQADPDTLWIAGASERQHGGLYTIKLKRDACRHIIGFEGSATKVADTPFIDANILEGSADTLIYTQWPQNKLSTIRVGASSPNVTVDLTTLGIGDSPGGLGFVPPPLAAKGQLRTVTWPLGQWWHVRYAVTAGVWAFDMAMQAQAASSPLTGNPGGFAYVPAGSPLFPAQSLIVAEWSQVSAANDRVAVYEVNAQGDPILSTRKEFFSAFPRPWGAYFEPVTGDYLFLTWNGNGTNDRVFLVQGFDKPPPPPEIN